MNRHLYILILSIFTSYANAQISESFNDSTIESSHTTWYGQLKDFKINADQQLQSQGNGDGISRIFTPIQISASMEWTCWLKLNFSPSESNRLRIYLLSKDTAWATTDAYYLEIGDNGNSDAIKFYKQISGKATLLAESTAGLVANEPVVLRLKMNKSISGWWMLSVDYEGGQNFIEEWSIHETSIKLNQLEFFGVACFYTPTRKDKFLFDDIFIYPDTPIQIPLRISKVISDSNEVKLYLNKLVDSISASDEENYVISNGVGQPRKARLLQDSIVILTLAQKLQPGRYDIICKSFKDLNGIVTNNLKTQWTHFQESPILPYELLINELMIDPSPAVQLPAYEYIEIYNHSDHLIDLSSIVLKTGSVSLSVDTVGFILAPGEYVLFCESVALESLKPYGRVIGMKKWPSLRNTDGIIGLYDSQDSLIHQVNYDDSWYRDTKKNGGGWSLEMINPLNVCDQKMNWAASNSLTGGTPGKINSIYDLLSRIPFRLDSIQLVNDQTLKLFLNKSVQINASSIFEFDPVLTYQFPGKQNETNQINLYLDDKISSGILYSLSINLYDCIGRPLESIDTFIANVETPNLHDLVISEILFNPKPGGSDFVEIYNKSGKILSADRLIISNEITGKQQIIKSSVLILPTDYWIISPDINHIKLNYTVPYPDQMINQTLPSWPDDHGQVSIWTFDKQLIDSCSYDENQHYNFLNSKDGVSLERIDLESALLPVNWHSASGASGYATPTGKNSVSKSGNTNNASRFKLHNKVFTPDDDGIDDVLLMEYSLSNNGYLARIDIYDDQGRPIKRLASNLSLSYTGSIEWNGKDDKNRNSPPGIYVISILSIHETEMRVQERLACVLLR